MPVKNLRCKFQGINSNPIQDIVQIVSVLPISDFKDSLIPKPARIKTGEKARIKSITEGGGVMF